MTATEIEGFLAAMIVGPKRQRPQAWGSIIWSHNEDVFESEEQAADVFGLIFQRHGEVSKSLAKQQYEALLQRLPSPDHW